MPYSYKLPADELSRGEGFSSSQVSRGPLGRGNREGVDEVLLVQQKSKGNGCDGFFALIHNSGSGLKLTCLEGTQVSPGALRSRMCRGLGVPEHSVFTYQGSWLLCGHNLSYVCLLSQHQLPSAGSPAILSQAPLTPLWRCLPFPLVDSLILMGHILP